MPCDLLREKPQLRFQLAYPGLVRSLLFFRGRPLFLQLPLETLLCFFRRRFCLPGLFLQCGHLLHQRHVGDLRLGDRGEPFS